MYRHPTHGNRLTQMKTALGQRNVQRFGGGHGVVKEHLVEIAHPVEQERAGVLRLDLQILRHHRRDGVIAHGVLPLVVTTLQKPTCGEKPECAVYADGLASDKSGCLQKDGP